jgi:hypothetical protein
MYRKLLLAAAAAVMATAVFAAPANAQAFRVIRWDATHVCQIWDFSLPTRPWPGDYTIVSKRKATFGAALAAQHRLWRRGVCGW